MSQLSRENLLVLIESRRTPKGGYEFTRDFLAELGVPWPPRRGWKARLLASTPSEASTLPGSTERAA